jgi:hypothetical protein
MWERPALLWRGFSKQLVGIHAFCGFPQMRHFHQAIPFLPFLIFCLIILGA